MNTRLSAVVFHLIHCNHAPCFRLSPDHLSLCPACRLLPRTDKSVLEQQKAVAVYSWEAQGQMVFRCTYDERGFFWAFLYPQGKLLDDKGREQAVLGSDFSVTARDAPS